MKKNELFYFEIKNKQGEFEPLGVMTISNAIQYSWDHGHASLKFEQVKDLHVAETPSH